MNTASAATVLVASQVPCLYACATDIGMARTPDGCNAPKYLPVGMRLAVIGKGLTLDSRALLKPRVNTY